MNLIWGILGTIVIVYIWIWIINNSFKNKKFQWNISINIFVLSIILVAFLYFYKDILIFFWIQDLYLLKDNSWKTIWSFIVYCLSFIILLTLSFGNIKKRWSIKFIFVSLLLFLGIWLWGSIMWINLLIMYYIVSSYAEEILKFSIWQNVFLEKEKMNNNKIEKWDLIFFAIIAGLWFSVIENLFYLIVHYFGAGDVLMQSVWRSIFATLLHVVATGIIAFFVVKRSNSANKKNILWILIWIISGFTLHGLYNLSLHYNAIIFTILILIVCYFILSFLLFKSDLIYQKK